MGIQFALLPFMRDLALQYLHHCHLVPTLPLHNVRLHIVLQHLNDKKVMEKKLTDMRKKISLTSSFRIINCYSQV